MRWLALGLLGLILVSGCSSPEKATANDATPLGQPTAADAPNATVLAPLRFAGETAEASLPIEDSFAAQDGCTFGISSCPPTSQHTYDLTPLVPANVPVELSAAITADASYNMWLENKDAQSLLFSQKYNQGTTTIDTTLVRAAAGTVMLVVQFYNFDLANPQPSVAFKGAVHSVSRNDVVPVDLPVAVQLQPGDHLNATADGLVQLVAYPPHGAPLRVVTGPYNITIPADAPSGTYIVLASAEEAVHLSGPAGASLQARLLDFTVSDPVDVASNADTSWDMAVPGQPLMVGVQMMSKGSFGQGSSSILPLVGSHKASLQAPGNVEVLTDSSADCGVTWCQFVILGQTGWGYASPFIDEHLSPGSYHATVSMKTSNNMQAYSWAMSVRATA
jgi:hypothetical protein